MTFSENLHRHEKLLAFLFLGAGIILLAFMAAYIIPQYGETETIKQLFIGAMGAFTLALGSATNALFRSKTDTVEIKQPEGHPVPVSAEPSIGELPEEVKL